MKISIKFIILLCIIVVILYNKTECQIKVFEKPPERYIPNTGIFFDSERRIRINLHGYWQVSFDEGRIFNNFNIPLSYNYEGEVLFKKSFSINDDYLKNFNFLLVCEGINYESDIKINNNFITKSVGSDNSIQILLEENVLQKENIIEIEVNNKLNNSSTIPLANQINYSNNFGGINKDIYLLVVPKVFILNSFLNYSIENDNYIKISNNCTIKSSNIEKLILEEKDFLIQTKIFRKSDGEEIQASDNTKFQIENYSQIKIENKLSFKNPVLWSTENPELYLVKIFISNNNNIIDELQYETGFNYVKINNGIFYLNGKQLFLKGINYHEESVKYGTALDFLEIEQDLLNIKSLGFNCIRVPGKSASPYTITVCNRVGLYLLQDFPFNEVPQEVLFKNRYSESAYEYLENIIRRDKNSVSILMWGIGNNFDVTSNASINYVKSAKDLIRKYDIRPVYYTTRNFINDSCSGIIDIRGLNIYTTKIEEIENSILEINKTQKKPAFISSYGVAINKENRNGFSDVNSNEFQTKFLIDCYKIFDKNFSGCLLSSFSDWTTSSPLILSYDYNPYLKTDGIFTIYREPKQAVGFLKHLLNNQDYPKIMEGNAQGDDSYYFIIIGIIFLILLLFFSSRFRKFKEILLKFTFKPTVFFELTKEQTLVPFQYNLLLSVFINIGLSLYLSGILYFYRSNISFDILISNIIGNSYLKILFSEYINSPYKLIIILFLIFLILQFVLTFALYFISFFTKGRTTFKNLYTITVWSSLPLLIFLPVGTIIYKLSVFKGSYINLSLYLYIILTIIFLYRIISGSRILFEITRIRAVIYGILIIIIFYGGIYSYFYFKNTFYILNLLLSYK